jgi:hypothetical protein
MMQKRPKKQYPRALIIKAAERWLHGEKLQSISLDLGMSPSYVQKIIWGTGTAYRWRELPKRLLVMILEKHEGQALAHLEDVRERLAAVLRGDTSEVV